MKKIRLDMEALAVESFAVVNERKQPRGTVRAFTGDLLCTTLCPTVEQTCTVETAAATCAGASCDIYHLCGDTRYPGC